MKRLITAMIAGVGLLAGLNAATAATDHKPEKQQTAPMGQKHAGATTTKKSSSDKAPAKNAKKKAPAGQGASEGSGEGTHGSNAPKKTPRY